MTQLALSFADRDRAVSQADIDALEGVLAGNGWLTAAELSARLTWTDRKVRAVANSDARFVSYPGSPGYKLLRDCTREEFARFCTANRSQAREMIGRTVRAMRAWHSYGRDAA